MRVGRRITLSARVGGARVTVLDLTGTPRVSRSGFGTNVSGLTARLNRAAARALNATFGVDAFRKGIPLGTVRVQAEPSQTELLAQGATALAIDPAALQAIVSLGIAPGRDRPGDARRDDGELPDHGRQGRARPERGRPSATAAASRSPRARRRWP